MGVSKDRELDWQNSRRVHGRAVAHEHPPRLLNWNFGRYTRWQGWSPRQRGLADVGFGDGDSATLPTQTNGE